LTEDSQAWPACPYGKSSVNVRKYMKMSEWRQA